MIGNFWLYSIIRARDLVSLKAIAWGISHNKIVILMSHWCWNLMTFCPHQNKGAVARIIIYQSGFFYFTFSSFFFLLHYKRKIAKCLWFRGKSYEKVGQAFSKLTPPCYSIPRFPFSFFLFSRFECCKTKTCLPLKIQ